MAQPIKKDLETLPTDQTDTNNDPAVIESTDTPAEKEKPVRQYKRKPKEATETPVDNEEFKETQPETVDTVTDLPEVETESDDVVASNETKKKKVKTKKNKKMSDKVKATKKDKLKAQKEKEKAKKSKAKRKEKAKKQKAKDKAKAKKKEKAKKKAKAKKKSKAKSKK